MGRKRNPYLPLFTRDIMSSPRCRALSREAAGVYLFLLCRLNEPPTPGAYRLSDWEEHANWSRSKTTRCLAEPDKYSRLQYFAKMLSVNDLPWRERDILESLQELYNRGIITVVGDALIQPRMFADGSTLSRFLKYMNFAKSSSSSASPASSARQMRTMRSAYIGRCEMTPRVPTRL